MSISYNVIPRKNPGDPSQPPKYYAQAISSGKVDMRELAEQISMISTVSSIDSMASLEALIQTIPAEIAKGNMVKLGDFGTFYLTLSSEGAETEDGFTAGNIKKYSIRFRPGKLFKNIVDDAGFKKA